MDKSDRKAKIEADSLEVETLLSRRSLTPAGVRRLVYLFSEYLENEDLGRQNIPHSLMRYISGELKKYVDDRSYKPFPVRTGRPAVLDWDVIDQEVMHFLALEPLEDSSEPLTLHDVFRRAIASLEMDPEEELSSNTLDKHIREFVVSNPDLADRTKS